MYRKAQRARKGALERLMIANAQEADGSINEEELNEERTTQRMILKEAEEIIARSPARKTQPATTTKTAKLRPLQAIRRQAIAHHRLTAGTVDSAYTRLTNQNHAIKQGKRCCEDENDEQEIVRRKKPKPMVEFDLELDSKKSQRCPGIKRLEEHVNEHYEEPRGEPKKTETGWLAGIQFAE